MIIQEPFSHLQLCALFGNLIGAAYVVGTPREDIERALLMALEELQSGHAQLTMDAAGELVGNLPHLRPPHEDA